MTTLQDRGDDTRVDDTPLARAISPRLLALFITGDILGAGIYALVGEVAGEVGGAIWASFLVAFGLAALTAFAYAELVTKYPHAAGAALYVNKAFRVPMVTFVVAIVVMASGISSAAGASRAFGGDYLSEFVTLPTVLVAIGFLGLIGLVNFVGIKESIRLNVVMTVIEAGGLLFIVGLGVATLVNGEGEPGRVLEFTQDGALPLAVLSGATLAFFSFIGFEDSVNVAEEVQDPSRSYPRALMWGLVAATTIYLGVALTASMVVPTDDLAGSTAPLLRVVELGPVDVPLRLFAAVALFALFNTALINMVMASRLLYGMANQGIMPRALGRVHPRRRTPWVAIVGTTVLAAALAATGDLTDLADTTVVLLLAVFTVVNICVFVLRRDEVDHDHYRAPLVLPALGAAASVVALVGKVFDAGPGVLVRAALLVLLGIALYVANRAATGRTAAELDASRLDS
ncbi:APC family permease [Iamia majanohamensis]|uniref:APC family permease n=1 Tax=Iamia majanohamensis TaxID=467976 RepID=A0AAE9Y328_9ACTN|nr:APC family permease [Iamia majanohamensis]WCO65405.1 APC family permease [Iamia majanohamensis]